jgi:hypothetical protein
MDQVTNMVAMDVTICKTYKSIPVEEAFLPQKKCKKEQHKGTYNNWLKSYNYR